MRDGHGGVNGSELAFDESCLVLVSDDELRVVSRAATTTLKSRNLGHLHRALSKYICGRYDQESILAGVAASQRPSVERYLSTLRNAGAIKTVRPHDGDVCPKIVFAEPKQIGRELLRADRSSHTIYVAVEGDLDVETQEKLARWLTNTRDTSFENGRTLVYRLDTEPVRLKLELELEGPDSAGTLAQRLGLLRPAEVPQLPLVCVTASHWLFPISLSRFGLEHEQVEQQLIREFLATMLEDGGASSSQIAELDREPCSLPVEHSEEVDLLNEPVGHAQIRYLCSVLRCRVSSLPGLCARHERSYFSYQARGHHCGSFIRAKALRDLLLQIAIDVYYGDRPCDMAVSPPDDFESFVDSNDMDVEGA